MNEKIVCAICQSLKLLAIEYRRALQGKHWAAGDPESGEVLANINFLVATGNDAHRTITTHIRSLQAVRVLSSGQGGVTDPTIQRLVEDFRLIIDGASKYISRIVLCDLHSVILDFHTVFSELDSSRESATGCSLVLKQVTHALNLYLLDLNKYSYETVFYQVSHVYSYICHTLCTTIYNDRCYYRFWAHAARY